MSGGALRNAAQAVVDSADLSGDIAIPSVAVIEALRAALAVPSPVPLDVEWLRIERGWPTPISMRRAADALDLLTPAKHGDVLRWVADLADAALSAPQPVQEDAP